MKLKLCQILLIMNITTIALIFRIGEKMYTVLKRESFACDFFLKTIRGIKDKLELITLKMTLRF